MQNTLIHEIEQFLSDTGLSEHRVGMILGRNGRLVERLRSKRRIWPETEAIIRENLRIERAKRLPDSDGAAQ